jgi:hypothetical protein
MIYPTVQRLDVHVEKQDRVVLQQGNDKGVMNKDNLGKANIIAFFDFNSLKPEVVSRKVHLDSNIQKVESQTRKIRHHWKVPYNPTNDARALTFEDTDVFQSHYIFHMTPTGKHVWLVVLWMTTMNGI